MKIPSRGVRVAVLVVALTGLASLLPVPGPGYTVAQAKSGRSVKKKPARAYATLRVSVDMDCELTVDKAKTPIAISAGTPTSVPIAKGDHLLRWNVPSANAMFYDWKSVEERGTQDFEREFRDDVQAWQDGAKEQEAAGTVVRGDLMWTVRDNGFEVNWYEAKAYCEACRVGGYSDWRMPTIEELAGLYDSNQSRRLSGVSSYGRSWTADVHIASPFRIGSPLSWSSTHEDSASAFRFSFANGRRLLDQVTDRESSCVLCVRRSGM